MRPSGRCTLEVLRLFDPEHLQGLEEIDLEVVLVLLLRAEQDVVEEEQPSLLLCLAHQREYVPLVDESAVRLSERRIVLQKG
jgi:hypothetical protein